MRNKIITIIECILLLFCILFYMAILYNLVLNYEKIPINGIMYHALSIFILFFIMYASVIYLEDKKRY